MSTFQAQPISFDGGTSNYYTTPYSLSLGTKARDSNGGEFVLCNTGSATIAPEMAVLINANWSLTAITTGGHNGPVGIVADLTKSGNTSAPVSPIPASSSVWVQVYGRAYVQIGGGAASPSDAANGATTIHTSIQTFFAAPTSVASTPAGVLVVALTAPFTTISNYVITGITVASDVTIGDTSIVTAVSATHIGARTAVVLNYPQIAYYHGTS